MPAGFTGRGAAIALLCLVAGYVIFERTRETPLPQVPDSSTTVSQTRPTSSAPATPNSNFDFYVLALSWSPSYCASEGSKANGQQCATGRRHGFVVHGLWPQFEQGYPQDCDVREREVSRAIANSLSDIMPSRGLAAYQWRKHGSCSGLNQNAYFQQVRDAYQRVTIPPRFRSGTVPASISPRIVEDAFITANPGLPRDAIAVTCDRKLLREVRICLDQDLDFRSCREVDRGECRQNMVSMPSPR